MRRREFIALASSSALIWPEGTAAQQTSPVVGFLAPMARDTVAFQAAAFRKGLAEAGFTDGSNLLIDYRWADHQVARVPALAAELVSRPVRVIAAFTTVAARAAKAATQTIPVVFVTGDDPVAAGLATSISRPEANLTGVTFASSALGSKRLELLRMLVPKADLIGILTDPNSSESVTQFRNVQDSARAISQSILELNAATDGEIDAAFAVMRQRNVKAFLANGSPFFNTRRERLVNLSSEQKLPGMFANRNFANVGGIISYGSSIPESYHQSGLYVGRILKGAKPSELPILQPTRFDLVINLKTAKAFGLELPDKLIALADDVIE